MNDIEFREHITRLKEAVRGEDIAVALGLRGRGKRFFCPSCQEDGTRHRTPDLGVTDKGFKCFKCGTSGDMIGLAVLAGNMSKADAISYLEQRTGIERPNRGYHDKEQVKKTHPIASLTPSATSWNHGKARNPVFQGNGRLPEAFAFSGLYTSFLEKICLPIHETPGATYLEGRGIATDIAGRYGVRFCPDPSGLWNLADQKTIKAAGLSSLFVFQKAGLPFLIFPYFREGKPVFLKTRSFLSKDEADRRDLPRFLNTGGAVPCLWNHDAVAGAEEILIAEGEIDALSAIAAGLVGVGLPGWSHWKDAWTKDFSGKEVILVMDADDAGQKGTADIARRFMKAGLPCPSQMKLTEGKDLNEALQVFMKDGKEE